MRPRHGQPSDPDCFSAHDGQENEQQENPLSLVAGMEGEGGSPVEPGVGEGANQPVTAHGHLSPSDFSAEDLRLARALNETFDLEQEKLPPLFFQTMTSPRVWSAPEGLERRVRDHVFEQLDLSRPHVVRPNTKTARGSLALRLRRMPRTIGFSTVFALVLLSLVAVAPSFAHGVRVLLGQSGVQLTPTYPAQTVSYQVQTQYLSLQEAHEVVPFDIYWLGTTHEQYNYQSLLIHVGQSWADGPVVEFQYGLETTSPGTGRLAVREFRPAEGSTVLLVVDQQAVQVVQIAGHRVIYIDGRWVQHGAETIWQYGTRAELVYEDHGMIFWITADQRDGASRNWLSNVVTSLEKLYLTQPRWNMPESTTISSIEWASALPSAEVGEVIATIPAGVSADSGAAVYVALGQPPDE
jgi:hypothetical protein